MDPTDGLIRILEITLGARHLLIGSLACPQLFKKVLALIRPPQMKSRWHKPGPRHLSVAYRVPCRTLATGIPPQKRGSLDT